MSGDLQFTFHLQVCSSCSLKSSCEKAYLLTNKEDEPRTIDVLRVLLTYGFDPVNGSVSNMSILKMKYVKTVVRKLIHEVVKLGSVPIDPNLLRVTRRHEKLTGSSYQDPGVESDAAIPTRLLPWQINHLGLGRLAWLRILFPMLRWFKLVDLNVELNFPYLQPLIHQLGLRSVGEIGLLTLLMIEVLNSVVSVDSPQVEKKPDIGPSNVQRELGSQSSYPVSKS
ncbi:unnamed protein product [Fraxinus pennsylvanica]|uniref:Uncharacterized protein n=1 Tax=Fraxinus pennsylvanica TaxID=56036 RepID=A0AAD1Z8H6_9LAMI|nr:unnamed protein product [Fraxinus pennsylvanica]